jgi:hypothetical protein
MYRYLLESHLSDILDVYLEVELLDLMVILFLTFSGTAILFPIIAVPFYALTINALVFQFFHLFTNTSYFLLFVFGNIHANGCK